MVNILLNFSDFFHSKPPFHIIIGKCQLSCGDMRQVKMRYKLRKKRCWAWQCIFPSTTTQKWKKNIKINIKKEIFKKILKNWSRYRFEEISPYKHSPEPCITFGLGFVWLLPGFCAKLMIFAQTLQTHIKSHTQKPCAGAYSRQRLWTKILFGICFRGPRGPN